MMLTDRCAEFDLKMIELDTHMFVCNCCFRFWLFFWRNCGMMYMIAQWKIMMRNSFAATSSFVIGKALKWDMRAETWFHVFLAACYDRKAIKKIVWMRVVAHCQLKSIKHYLRNHWFLRLNIARRVATSHKISSPIDELNEIGLNFRTLKFYHIHNAEICILNACQLAVQWLWHRSMAVHEILLNQQNII